MMVGARQGLQGATINAGGSMAHHFNATGNQRLTSCVTNSVTNDRLSSVQFMLSQSDKEGTLNAS